MSACNFRSGFLLLSPSSLSHSLMDRGTDDRFQVIITSTNNDWMDQTRMLHIYLLPFLNLNFPSRILNQAKQVFRVKETDFLFTLEMMRELKLMES